MGANTPRGLSEAERGFVRGDSPATGIWPVRPCQMDRHTEPLMYRIGTHAQFSPVTYLWELDAPDIAHAVGPGQFVIVRHQAGRVRGRGLRSPRPRAALRSAQESDLRRRRRGRGGYLPSPVPVLGDGRPIIVDGIGLCGSCRITVAGQMKFACLDGPEFDGHQVNFEELALRGKRFEREERESPRPYQQCRHTSTPA